MTRNVIAIHPSMSSKDAEERHRVNRARYLKQFYRTEELICVRLHTDVLIGYCDRHDRRAQYTEEFTDNTHVSTATYKNGFSTTLIMKGIDTDFRISNQPRILVTEKLEEQVEDTLGYAGLLLMRTFPRLRTIEVGDHSVNFTLVDYPTLQVSITINHV